MGRLVFTYVVYIPVLMTVFVLIVYTTNIAAVGIFVQRPYRSYFVNYTVTRILSEIIALAFLGFIVAAVLYAPTYFDKDSITKLDALSPFVKWCLQGVAIGIPTLVLLGLRYATVQGLRANAEKH